MSRRTRTERRREARRRRLQAKQDRASGRIFYGHGFSDQPPLEVWPDKARWAWTWAVLAVVLGLGSIIAAFGVAFGG